jgi:hypothetical protein
MNVEPYDRKLGCVAFPYDGTWVVVEPSGKLVAVCWDDEQEARRIAEHRNIVERYRSAIMTAATLAVASYGGWIVGWFL